MPVINSYRFWTPAKLSPSVWLDASNAASFTYSSGVDVSQWNDLSGNGFHATQATSTAQPSRDGTINSRTAVTFDGVDETMTIADPDVSSPYWVWVVFNLPSTPTVEADLLGQTSPLFAMRPKWSGEGGGRDLLYSGGVASWTPEFATGTHCWGGYINSTSGYERRNGVASATDDTGNLGLTAGGVRICRQADGSAYLNAVVAEIVIKSGSMTADEISSLESYFTAKWGKP